MKEENFWGDLENIQLEPTPLLHLKDQASKLAKLTTGIIRANVKPVKTIAFEFTFNLNIIAPHLNNYEIEIVRIGYNMDLYPVKLSDMINKKTFDCSSEVEFQAGLKEILSSAKVRQIIKSLLSTSADAKK